MEKLLKIIRGYLIAFGLFLFLLLFLTLILKSSSLSIGHASLYGTGFFAFSAFLFGIFIGRAFQKRGLVAGLAGGVLYTAVFVFLTSALFDRSFADGFLHAIRLLPVFCAGIGGIVGTNLKK